MTKNNQFQSFIRSRVVGAIQSARASSTLTHQGVKGTILEILIRDLFNPLLPSDIGVGSGQIIECKTGNLSPQTDIILYDKSILPPILFDESNGIFPIESVLYAIEVKTTLTKRDVQQAHESAKILDSFSYIPGKQIDGTIGCSNPEKCRSVIFALGTDLSENGKSEIERYKEIYKDDPTYVVAICVAGKEYWYRQKTAWIKFEGTDDFDEILGFIAGVTNTYRSVSISRGYPQLGNYIAPSDIAKITFYPVKETMSIHIGTDGIKIIDPPSSDDPTKET